jgi:hypothetical protein
MYGSTADPVQNSCNIQKGNLPQFISFPSSRKISVTDGFDNENQLQTRVRNDAP